MATPWAVNLLQNAMGVRPGERVLALVDEPLRPAGEALCAAAAGLGARAALRALPAPRGPLAAVTAPLLQAVQAADVIVSLHAGLGLAEESAPLRAALAAFRAAGHGRWGMAAHATPAVLEGALAADPGEAARATARLAGLLAGVREVRLTSAAGTDLTFRVAGRPVLQDTGVLLSPGAFGNLPGGEAYVAPLEDSAEGRLIVDLTVGDIRLSQPLVLEFRAGRAVAVSDSREATELRQRLGSDPWAWTIGEFGIGANANISICGHAVVDEKALGTVHVALGGNRSFGGTNPATTHYDCVLSEPQVFLDGTRL